MHSQVHGKLCVLTEDNTLGEECILDKRYTSRLETVYADSEQAGVLEISTEGFLMIKELMYESGLKKDFLMLESTMRRNYINKKNIR
jgi:hypothetical protein